MKPAWGWVVLAAVVLAAGCGDEQLWQRWQAERSLEEARRAADRVLVQPTIARDADWDRADRLFARVTERWPVSRWVAEPGKYGADIARVSGQAAVSRARLAALRGHDERTLLAWRAAVREVAPLPRLSADAAQGELRLLERTGRFEEQLDVLRRLSEDVPLRDPAAGWLADVLQAPLRWARELRARGRESEVEPVLRRAEARVRAALANERAPGPAPLLDALSEYTAARGDFTASMAALRARLDGARDNDERRTVALTLATRALDLGQADSALACARWAESLGGRTVGRAQLRRAEAWEQLGQPDSALEAYSEVTDRPRDPDNLASIARFQRGLLFERLGRWEAARAEWRTLQAMNPTGELSFQSMQKIVQHHLDRGEVELAQYEARRAIADLEQLLTMNADPHVQRQARLVRAEMLAGTGASRQAVEAFLDLWNRFPGDSVAEAAGLRAARMARFQPGLGVRADSLLERLATRAVSTEIRRAAAADRMPGR